MSALLELHEGVVPKGVSGRGRHERVLHAFVVDVRRLHQCRLVVREVHPEVGEGLIVEIGIEATVVKQDKVASGIRALDVVRVSIVRGQEPREVGANELSHGPICPEKMHELRLRKQRLPLAAPLQKLTMRDAVVLPHLVDVLGP